MKPVEALQAALAGEHAALYVYGVVGGRVSVSAQPTLWSRVRSAYTTHRGRRDQLISMIRAAGARPVAAEISYELPNAARTVAELTAASLDLELRCTAVYADVVGSTAGANRQWALEAINDAAVRQLGFGGEPEAFPGVAEL
ncbi:MAG TPA: ferritin-like domain-containing protein [Nocardioidaceae bacterium]|nr:ferritin-like domain-containing protein [Nocardioidaceae bacterium]